MGQCKGPGPSHSYMAAMRRIPKKDGGSTAALFGRFAFYLPRYLQYWLRMLSISLQMSSTSRTISIMLICSS